jgi:YidC/Oxa1 family membrane protein insertase
MDNKRLISHLAIAVALIAAWWSIRSYVNHIHPEYAQEMAAQEAAAQNPATAPSTPSTPATAPTTGPAQASASTPEISAGMHLVPSTQPAAVILLGSDVEKDSKYAMQVRLSSMGAGIEQVTLNKFRQTVRGASLYSFQEPYQNHPETAPLATRSVTVDGTSVDAIQAWTLTHSDASSAAYTALIAINDHPIARLTKKFTLPDIASSAKQSQGYELQIDYRVENLTDHAITVQTVTNGPTVPPKEVERGTDQQILVGYNAGGAIRVVQHAIEEFHKDKASQDLTETKDQPAAWAGTASVYFNAVVLTGDSPAATATTYTINADNIEPEKEVPSAVEMGFQTGQVKVAAGGTAQLPMSVFFGPKERKLLETAYFQSFPRQYSNTLVIVSGPCGICTFAWLINVLVAMLTFFQWIVRDWGLAIICLVVVVRVILHPIAKKSQVQMAKMAKMGPEMERLKQKYGDDKDALNKAMMQYYKEQGPAQILGCLPMFLQTPIWIALWSALQSTFELRHSPFLAIGHVHLTWIRDLANPDALFHFAPFSVPFLGELSSFNLLPLLLGVVFYFQQKFTPKPVAATPDQQTQQKMMTWMSTLMFPLMLYKGPAGLTLYIFTSTTIGIIEGKIIRDHIKQREEAEKAGRVFVDAKPTRGARRKDKDKKDDPPKKKTGIMGWFANLQARAEEIRRQAEKGK